MTTLRIGILHPDPIPIGQGINGALRGFVTVDDEEIQVIAKYLPDREILCEILCAQLGIEIGLPIPEPLLIVDDNNKLLFGSVNLGYPNLLHFLDKTADESLILSKLRKWIYLESASFFDELIINADRHPGNLLYDGDNFYLIDHGLTLHETLPIDFGPDQWENKLLSFRISFCTKEEEKSTLCNNANQWHDNIQQENSIAVALSKTPGSEVVKNALYDILSGRQKLLVSMVSHRVKGKQVDFIND